MYPHRIRLRGPWECEPLVRADGAPLPPPGRVTVPCRWDYPGRIRLRRRFGYPGRIEAHERVWLTFAAAEAVAKVWLNGEELALFTGTGPFDFEVTGLLRPRNELTAEVETPGGDGGLWGEVALEVRCTAYLQHVRVWEEGGSLHAAGEVAGTAERPLDLYVVLDRSTVAYGTVEAHPEGRAFHLTAEGVRLAEGQPQDLRVELVNGAVVWYAWEQRT